MQKPPTRSGASLGIAIYDKNARGLITGAGSVLWARTKVPQKKMEKPYIGITDFMTPDQVESAVKMLQECPQPRTERLLGVGVMMSYKTLNGITTKWSDAFPKNGDVARIFIDSPHVYNVLHYADFDEVDLAANLKKARGFGGDNMHALQLDMRWPDPAVVNRFIEANPEIDVIMQVGRDAFKDVGDDQFKLIDRLEKYFGLKAVLLDKSMGKGVPMKAEDLLPFVRTIYSAKWPMLKVVVAGGLGPETTHLVEPIMAEYPMTSTDAQGQLRASASALEPIEWDRAFGYMHKMMQIYANCDRVADSIH